MLTFVLGFALIGQTVKMPATVEVPVGRLAAVAIEHDGDDVTWVVPPALDVFREYDPDPKKIRLRLIGYTEGKYTLSAVAAKNVDGKAKLSPVAVCDITVGKPKPVPPVDPPPPIDDPTKPPDTTVGYYFLVVRQDGPAQPSFTSIMADAAWDGLRAKGHSVKDKTVTDAAKLGITVPATSLPAVVTLKVSADKKTSRVARKEVALPTTPTDILKLLEGLP